MSLNGSFGVYASCGLSKFNGNGGSPQAAGARDQATALANRLPGAGLFELFRGIGHRWDRFRFDREADDSPAQPWGWDDLE